MAEKETKDKQRTEKPLDKMTVVELREIAKEIPDVTGVSGMKKDQLLAIVKEARSIEEKPAKKKSAKKKTAKKKGSTPVKEMTVKELKAEIARLRAEKEELRMTARK
jgi:hypothetical protein